MPVNAEVLRKLRVENRLSVRQLAKSTGLSAAYISDLENGHRKNISVDALCEIAKVLEVDPSELYYCK